MQAPSEEDVARQEALKQRLEEHAHWKRAFFQSRPPPVFVPKCRRRREKIADAPVHIFYERALKLLKAENKLPSASPLPGAAVKKVESTGPSHRRDVWLQQMTREMNSRDPYTDLKVSTDPRRTVVMSGLHRKSVEEDLRLYAQQFGYVVSVRLIRDHRGRSRGYGFVQYRLEGEAHKAVRHSCKQRLHGRSVVIEMERGRLDPNFLPKRMAEAQRYRQTVSSSLLPSSALSGGKRQRDECDEHHPSADAGVQSLTAPLDKSRDEVDALLDEIMNLT